MRHLQFRVEISDLAAEIFAALRKARLTTPHDEVAKAAGEAFAIWLVEVGYPDGKFEELSGAFSAALIKTGAETVTAIQENFIASKGGRN